MAAIRASRRRPDLTSSRPVHRFQPSGVRLFGSGERDRDCGYCAKARTPGSCAKMSA
jgi:hypothetical protein